MPSQKPMLREIEWGVQNGPITKNAVLPVTIFFWKFCFSIRTVYKDLIWGTNYPNVHIHSSRKHWNFVWGFFFTISILKIILLLPLKTISIRMSHILWEQFCCSCMYNKTSRNTSQLFKACIRYFLSNFYFFTKW